MKGLAAPGAGEAGQPLDKLGPELSRRMDVSQAIERFGFVSTTPFAAGLRQMIEWFIGTTDPEIGDYGTQR